VQLVIYDVLGRQVAALVDGVQAPGQHEVVFNASTLPSGIYLARLFSGDQTRTIRMTLVK
jgi:hypothetical protein